MITRIVKMTFKSEYLTEFVDVFNYATERISSFDGCCGVRLMQDVNNENVYFTFSSWQSENHLNLYRSSVFFKAAWIKVKPMFSAKAEAWSLVEQSKK